MYQVVNAFQDVKPWSKFTYDLRTRIKDHYANDLYGGVYWRIDRISPLIPTIIGIETINRCTGHCEFCPSSVENESRPFLKMSNRLFGKIIDDLADIDFYGQVQIFGQNEPTLDNCIIDRQKQATKATPKALHTLCTNGDLLKRINFNKLVESLDGLTIDNYSDTPIIKPHIFEALEDLDEELTDRVTVQIINRRQIRTSRGGTAPNHKIGFNRPLKCKCSLPWYDMEIRPDGKLSLCCADAIGQHTLGDLNSESVIGAFNNNRYNHVRHILKTVGRSGLNVCDKCDMISM